MTVTMNHSEFIRNHPNLSVADLIQEAGKKGLDIKKNLIYNVRSKDKKAAEAGGGSAPKAKKASKKPVVKAKVAAVKTGKKASKKAKVAAVRAVQAPVVTAAAPVARKAGNGSKYTLTVTLDVHDPSSLKNSKGLISSLFSG